MLFARTFGRVAFAVVGMGVASMASAVILYTTREADDTLTRIDTTTLTETPIGPYGVTFNFGDLAYDTSNNTMYMIDGRGNQSLYTVNLGTGAATLVGRHGITDLFALAWDPVTSQMFAGQFGGGQGTYTMNLSTGAATLVGASNINNFGGMVENRNTGALVGIGDGTGNLYTINRSTGAGTLLASPGNNNDSGLTFDPATGLYWNIDWSGNLFSIDPSAGYARTTVMSGLGSHDGLALIPAVPEPASLAAIGLGFAALLRRRRKTS